MQSKYSTRRQVRNLLCVLVTAVVSAFAVATLLVVYYNPSENYLIRNVLLSPEILTTLSYQETDVNSRKADRYVFAGIDFAYYDPEQKILRHVPISKELYEQFYHQVLNDKSLTEVSEGIRQGFTAVPAILSIKVKGVGEPKGFQEVQFQTGGDYYRVQLRQEGSQDAWAYYYHPKIYEKVTQAFFGKT